MFRRLPFALKGRSPRPKSSNDSGGGADGENGRPAPNGGPDGRKGAPPPAGRGGRFSASFTRSGRPLRSFPFIREMDFSRGLVVLELHEGKAARATRLAIGGDLGVDHLARGAERLDELIAGDVEAQVAYENLVRNGVLLLVPWSEPPVAAWRATDSDAPGRGSRGRATVTESSIPDHSQRAC